MQDIRKQSVVYTQKVSQADALKYGFPLDAYLPEWNYEAAEVFLLAGEADVVCGDEHLTQNVPFVKRSPEGAVGVAI